MTYTDAAALAADSAFTGRVRSAMYAACGRIGGGSFENEKQRSFFVGLMAAVVNDPDKYAEAFSWLITSAVGLGADCADTDLDTALTSLWPVISGYLAATGTLTTT